MTYCEIHKKRYYDYCNKCALIERDTRKGKYKNVYSRRYRE